MCKNGPLVNHRHNELTNLFCFYFQKAGAQTTAEPRSRLGKQVLDPSSGELARPKRPDGAIEFPGETPILFDVVWTSPFSSTGGQNPQLKNDKFALVNARENAKAKSYSGVERTPRLGEEVFGIAIETMGIVGPRFSNFLDILKERLPKHLFTSFFLELLLLIPKYLYLALPF